MLSPDQFEANYQKSLQSQARQPQQPQSPQAQGYMQAMQQQQAPPQQQGNFIQNAANDTGSLLKGLLNLPGVALGALTNPSSIPQVGGNIAKGLVGEYGDLISNPVKHGYEKPVSTLLDIIPFLKPLKALAGLGEAGKATEVASEAGNVASKAKKASIASQAERMAFNAPNMVVNEQGVLQDILQSKAGKQLSKTDMVAAKAARPGGAPNPTVNQASLVNDNPSFAGQDINAAGGRTNYVPNAPQPNVNTGEPSVAQAPDQLNFLQKAATKVGGQINPPSQKYLETTNNLDNAIPREQTASKYGIDKAFTDRGKILQTDKAIKTVGSNLGKSLKTDYRISNTALANYLGPKLKAQFDPAVHPIIDEYLAGVKKGGKFDITSGEQSLGGNELNTLKSGLTKYGTKNVGVPVTGPIGKEIADSSAALIRKLIEDKIPGATKDLREYQGLMDIKDQLTDPKGFNPKGRGALDTILSPVLGAAKTAASRATQGAYDLGGILPGDLKGVPGGVAGGVGKLATSRLNQILRTYPTDEAQPATLSPIAQGPAPTADNPGNKILPTDALGARPNNPYQIENYIKDATRDPRNQAYYKQIYDSYQAQDQKYQKSIDDFKKSDEYKNATNASKVKDELQNIIGQFQSVPSGQTGIVGGLQSQVPLLGQAIAPQATEYENSRNAIAPILKEIAGAGLGSGVRVTQAEITNWAKLLPSVHKTPEQNKIAIQQLNDKLRAATGVSLDSSFLQ